MDEVNITLRVNGDLKTRSAGSHLTLLRWLRDQAGVLDPKYGCGEGICGACTVLVDGEPVSSCLVLAAQVKDAEITTAAGITRGGESRHLYEAFHEHHAAQCGFCTPGMVVLAAWLLANNSTMSREQIRDELHGNLCRCTGYQPIVDAIESAFERTAHERDSNIQT